jgi:hypothetical protein
MRSVLVLACMNCCLLAMTASCGVATPDEMTVTAQSESHANNGTDGLRPVTSDWPELHALSGGDLQALPAEIRGFALQATSDRWFRNYNSNLLMEVFQSSRTNGGKVDQFHLNNTSTQKWRVVHTLTDTVGTIFSIINVNSGKCLDTGSSTANGTQLTQWTCESGNIHQMFYILEVPGLPGVNYISSVAAYYDVHRSFSACVEVFQSSFNDLAKVDLWDCNDTFTQRWTFLSPLA